MTEEPKYERRVHRYQSRISPEEIAKDLDVSRTRVYRMLEARIIPGVRMGRGWIVTRFAYENWKRTCGQKTDFARMT